MGKERKSAHLQWMGLTLGGVVVVVVFVCVYVCICGYVCNCGYRTRMRAVQGVTDVRVLGCLLGQQNGRVVEISNSFELSYAGGTDGSPIAINKDFLNRKQEQCTSVGDVYMRAQYYRITQSILMLLVIASHLCAWCFAPPLSCVHLNKPTNQRNAPQIRHRLLTLCLFLFCWCTCHEPYLYTHVCLYSFIHTDHQVFPQLEIVGWYSTGSDIEPSDMDIHKWIAGVNENPLYLLFDPAQRDADACAAATSTVATSASASKQLPVYVFESKLSLASAEEQQTEEEEGRAGGSANVLQASTLVFTRSSYVIETVEAERIAVDQVAKIEAGSGQSSSVTRLASNLTGVHSAIKMLNARIKVIHDFLLDTKSGKIPMDHGLLRQIASITHSLPTMQSSSFREELVREHNDTMLLSYLAVMTAGTADINSISEKVNVVSAVKERGSFRQRMPM